jgi:hypothetical protein
MAELERRLAGEGDRPPAGPPDNPSPAPAEEPVWPDDSAEEAFLAGRRPPDDGAEAVEPAAPGPPPGEPAGNGREDLPPLDDLVGRVPPGARAVLDELFRAKFTAVRRVPKESLK